MSNRSAGQFYASLRIIDALAPFSLPSKREVINWSKVDFAELETRGKLTERRQNQIIKRFTLYVERAAALGYNALSIDDLAHLVNQPYYDPQLQALLGQYARLYKKLFAIAVQHKMQIFVNTDYLFSSDAIEQHLAATNTTPQDFFATIAGQLCRAFPEVNGVILRIGESDGNDVDGHFVSRLAIRTPQQANELLKAVLPVFEKHDKLLVFRTWTVGAYAIGDFIWNQRTLNKVLSSVDSNNLIISMKFGDTDFMRYLTLNPLFFASSHKKIIELQTRREWEGMGEFPSFVGWDYAQYLQQLAGNPKVIGVHVWCQTGGWAVSNRSSCTLLDKGAFWNELNTSVTAGLSQGKSIDQAITAFCKSQHITDAITFTSLLELANKAICEGLYIKEFADHTLYFRRIRIPPLLWLMWDSTVLNSAVRSLFQVVVTDKTRAIQEGYNAVDTTKQMISIAKKLKLPAAALQSLAFEEATLALLANLRKYLLVGLQQQEIRAIQEQYAPYCKRFPQHYLVEVHDLRAGTKPPSGYTKAAITLLVRKQPQYRTIDKLLLAASPLQRRLARHFFKKAGDKIANQSMGLESTLK